MASALFTIANGRHLCSQLAVSRRDIWLQHSDQHPSCACAALYLCCRAWPSTLGGTQLCRPKICYAAQTKCAYCWQTQICCWVSWRFVLSEPWGQAISNARISAPFWQMVQFQECVSEAHKKLRGFGIHRNVAMR